jgi:hypothetical protein
VLERKVKHGMLWDTDYPERQIYSEGVEVRIGDESLKEANTEVGYRWLSDAGQWNRADPPRDGVYRLALRGTGAIKADLLVEVAPWPDEDVTHDR